MKLLVKIFILWISISSTSANSGILTEENMQRVRRSGTTVCVEVRPTRSHQEPYYMCKGGGEMPVMPPTSTLRPYSSEKFLPSVQKSLKNRFAVESDVSTSATFDGYRGQSLLGQQNIYSYRPQKLNDYNLQRTNQQSSLAFAEPNQQVWAFPRFQQKPSQTQPVLPPTLQSEPTARSLELHAQNAPYFATAEKPVQTLQTQYRYQPKQPAQMDLYRFSGQEEAPVSYIPRHRYGFSEPDQRSSFPYTANYRSQFYGDPSQSSNFRYNTASENDSPNSNEQLSYAFLPTLDQLDTMDRSTYEPFTGAARPNSFQKEYNTNRQSISDTDLSFGDVEEFPNDFTTQQPPFSLIVDVTPEEFRSILNQQTVPTEYMSDPVLRTFYSSLVDQKDSAKNVLTDNVNELNENQPAKTPINKQIPQRQVKTPLCSSCEKTTDDDMDDSMEKVSSSGPCANKDFNWPPVVIAMPCCGQQTSTPSTPPMPTAGFYNPYSMPMLSMFPSFMTPYNSAAMENTNYAQAFQHQNYKNMPQMSSVSGQSRSANNENQQHETTTFKTTTENINKTINVTDQTTDIPDEVIENTTNEPITPQSRSMFETKDDKKKTEIQNSEDNLSAETTTTTDSTLDPVTSVTDVTEIVDELKLKEDPPQTFQSMLNRAKTFKELAEKGLKEEEETLNHDAKKGKRQNFKDANAALRTIAEVVAASNKRKYSTMIH